MGRCEEGKLGWIGYLRRLDYVRYVAFRHGVLGSIDRSYCVHDDNDLHFKAHILHVSASL